MKEAEANLAHKVTQGEKLMQPAPGWVAEVKRPPESFEKSTYKAYTDDNCLDDKLPSKEELTNDHVWAAVERLSIYYAGRLLGR